MTRELAIIHARENIRVNALCPGPLHTELLMCFLKTACEKSSAAWFTCRWGALVRPKRWPMPRLSRL